MNSCPSCHTPCRNDDSACHKCGSPLDATPFESVRELLAAAASRQSIFESRLFLFLCFLGLSPLALATFASPRLIIDSLSIWTSLCWGILLFRLFAPPALGIKTALGVLLLTSFVVMPAFEAFLKLWPPSWEGWLESDSLPKRLLAFVMVVGIREELFKAIPVIAVMAMSPALRQPRSGVVLGMMAGVGFAATENVFYVYYTLAQAVEKAGAHDMSALLVPVYNNLVRTMVGPFAHATFSGLMGALTAAAAYHRAPGIFIGGLALAASLHGAYDTVVSFSGQFGVVVLGVALFLTMVAHAGSRVDAGEQSRGEGLFSRTIVRSPPPRADPTPLPRVPWPHPPVLRPAPPPTLPVATLGGGWSVSIDGKDGIPIPPYVPLKIGRDSSICAVVVNDPAVSRLHATISMKGPQPQIVRVSRVGKITVNSREVESAVLATGDEICIAGAVLRVGWKEIG